MPSQITDVEKFVQMSATAKSCSVKRLKSSVKLKLHTPKQLYTLIVEPANVEELIKRIKCTVEEV
jgi:hypothetical protein